MRTHDPVTTEAELAAAPRGVTVRRGKHRIRASVVLAGRVDGQRWWTVITPTHLQPGDTIEVQTAPADTRFCGFDQWGVYDAPAGGDAA